jgi:hypothetical protein
VAQTTRSSMLRLDYGSLALNLKMTGGVIPALEDRNSDKDAAIGCHKYDCEYNYFLESWVSF